jgi:hypothetical protein
VKRGWTTWSLPNVLRPQLSAGRGVILLGTAAIYAVSVWDTRRQAADHLALCP